jgi:hypothetical protein
MILNLILLPLRLAKLICYTLLWANNLPMDARLELLAMRLEMKAAKNLRALLAWLHRQKVRRELNPPKPNLRREFSENCQSYWAGVQKCVAHAAEREAASRGGIIKTVQLAAGLLRNIFSLLIWRSLMHLRRESLFLFLKSPLCPLIIRCGGALLRRLSIWWWARLKRQLTAKPKKCSTTTRRVSARRI